MSNARSLHLKTAGFTAAVFAACLLGATSARADLVVNGGFETGTFSSWTNSDPTGNTIDSSNPYAGTYDASLGSFGANGTLSQNLATTPGAKYTLSFALSNQDTTFSGDLLTLTFGGATVFSSTGILAGPGYNLFSFTETATGLSTALVFTERNDNSVWNLDAVSVTPITISVPEPSSALLFLAAAGTCLGALRVRRRA